MMPNISNGDRMDGLILYLVGPGRQDEHVSPHLVAGSPSLMAWYSDTTLDEAAARDIAKQLDHPFRAFSPSFSAKEPGHVWHCSLALRAEEGALGDEKWGEIAEDFMREMGFLDEGKAAVRYVAIHHGQTVSGNDHIHLAVERVREDGTKINVWNDRPRAQKACRALEQKYGLQVVEGRGIGMGERGRKPHAMPRPAERGGVRPVVAETYDERLERIVRAVAQVSPTEAEFVRGLRRAGLLAKPRFGNNTEDVVEGYSVATRPAKGQKPQWRGGYRLAKDCSLPALRDAHWPTDPNDPAKSAKAAMEAAAEWRSAKRNRRIPGAPPAAEVDPQRARELAEEIHALRQRLNDVPAGDVGTWSGVAHHLAGTFSAWSWATEGDTAGPLARIASTMSRTAQVPRGWHEPEAHTMWGPSLRGVSLILASVAAGGRGPVGLQVLLRQLANTAKALHDAHLAEERVREAQAIQAAMVGDLESVRAALPSDDLRQAAARRPVETGQQVGVSRPVTPGSPLPAHLQPHRQTQRTGGHDRGR